MQSKQIHFYQLTPEEFKLDLLNDFNSKLIEFKKSLSTQKSSNEELMSVEETLKFLKCSKQALWNWRKNGILPCHRLGNRVYYKKSDIYAKLIKQE
jgi:hypothetical protein